MMQGNKKCTDGFSDSSSIGSVLDDADREVSNLTDRAFRSLCISEDTSFHDSDLALSPDITGQVFGTFHQETVSHSHRKSGIWSQLPSQGTEHTGWAATFQQLPKYVQGEEKYPKSSPPPTPAQRRLEVPVSGLRSSNKPISKVSSLIRSFDRTENQSCDSRPPPSKPPALKNPPKFAPLPDSSVNFCFDSAFLTVRRVPAEVSTAHQSSHQSGRIHGEQESPKNPEMASHSSGSLLLRTSDHVASSFESRFPSPPHKSAKAEPGRGKEWAPKGTFLHSENSAFESWNNHQPKLLERKDVAEAIPESKASRHCEDTPLIKEPYPAEHKVSPFQGRAICAQEENRSAPGPQSTSKPWGARDLGAQVFPVEGNASVSQLDPQLKQSQPPWRKPKTGKGRKDGSQDALEDKKQTNKRGPPLYSKHNSQGQLPENDALDMPGDPNDHYSPPFNISKLLTPIIPTKHTLEPSDTQSVEISPSPPTQLNGYQEKELSEDQNRDSYKSKAPSLLFNLKDVRRHVKSTYSPLPLLKNFDEKTRGKLDGKQEPVSNGVILPNGLEESLPTQLSKERPADASNSLHSDTQRDSVTNPSESSADSHPAINSPLTSAKAHICINGEAAERSSNEKEDALGESELDPSRAGWCPDSRERLPQKHLSLKLCNKESETRQAAEKMKPHELENGLSRSISQETGPKQEVRPQNLPLNQKFSPGPISPEEEDVFYSDSQSDFTPCLQTKAKFSTSSSDQSFASFDDQQKTWFTEGPQENRKNDVSAGDNQKDGKENVKEKDEPESYALSNGHRCTEEHRQEELLEREAEGSLGGRPRKASMEEANFRGSRMGADKDIALSHAKDSIPLPASTNKHRLFAIKDNTLRATPVIKPIILPLLRTLSEDSLGGGHKEDELARKGWSEDTGGLCALESQELPGILPSSTMQATHQKSVLYEDAEHPVYSVAQAETPQQTPKGGFLSIPLVEEGDRMKPPLDAACEVLTSGRKNRSGDLGKLSSPRHIPRIALPPDDLAQASSLPLRTCWEEQGFQSHFLSAPRVGPQGRRLVPSATATSPNPSSLGDSSTCSPAASSIWDDASQVAGEHGLRQEAPGSSPWASPGPARFTRREDLTHGLTWEADNSDPQLEPSAEDLRTLSPRGTLLDVAANSADAPEKPEPPALLERAAGKPPAVPPKTEKALRRAKKLASKRRKSDQAPPEKQAESWEGRACAEDMQGTEQRPVSPGEKPGPRFPAIRSLPPPVHRHSVSCGWEPVGRRPWGPQALTPLPPYPATQKVLQDPQSGQYFVFDVPVQVKIKTFYDPETGKYVKVSVPSEEEASSEPPLQDALAAPYLLYPGFRPVPVTSLMPLRCSSQLAAPTFLRQGPRSRHRPQSTQGAELHAAPGPQAESTQHAAAQRTRGPPQSPEEEGAEAPGLSIISTDDLEDFATEGIS